MSQNPSFWDLESGSCGVRITWLSFAEVLCHGCRPSVRKNDTVRITGVVQLSGGCAAAAP